MQPIKEAFINDALREEIIEPFTIQDIQEVDGDYIMSHQSDPQEIPADTYDWIERVWLVRVRLSTGYERSYYVAIPVEGAVVLKG